MSKSRWEWVGGFQLGTPLRPEVPTNTPEKPYSSECLSERWAPGVLLLPSEGTTGPSTLGRESFKWGSGRMGAFSLLPTT